MERVTAVAYVEDVMLVDRCLTGEPAATRELFRKHRARVHASLFRVLGGNRDMDDLLQDAFLQVFQSLKNWRAEASLATWIDRVAVRVAYRYLSKRTRQVITDPMSDEDAAIATAGEQPGARRQLARDGVKRLYLVLDALAPGSRLAFTLHEIDGRPLAEVAKLVGASQTATKLRVWRARKAVFAAAEKDPVLQEFIAPLAVPNSGSVVVSTDSLTDESSGRGPDKGSGHGPDKIGSGHGPDKGSGHSPDKIGSGHGPDKGSGHGPDKSS